MSGGWQVGDLAVCVDASDAGGLSPDAPQILKTRAVYRVASIQYGQVFSNGQSDALVLIGAERGHGYGWAVYRFRKIKPADPAFAEHMRSLKPRVDA